ncbi:TBC1 domain family member 2A [Polypterus senegalus]|uniref:TBC1 domain family member 2A n=1 Tax=Polypterus senegalus TaxID=55291 RepID=UPI0019623421|nr:TBC1 domain family member 2A [Polypterus senegalus]
MGMENKCESKSPLPVAVSSAPHQTDLDGEISSIQEISGVQQNEMDFSIETGNVPEKRLTKKPLTISTTKLCGYLNKQGGPLKQWKSRWFIYEEKKCQLYYYRTSQDVNPLGSIDLTSAVFSYPPEPEEGIFEIHTPERVFVLKAVNNHTMMYWLQQLQVKRWQHSSSGVRTMLDPATAITEKSTQPIFHEKEECIEDLMPTVKTPTGLVGEAATPWQQTSLQNLSLKHPITELQNTVLSICSSKSLQERCVLQPEDPQQGVGGQSKDVPMKSVSENSNPPQDLKAEMSTLASQKKEKRLTLVPSLEKMLGKECTNGENTARLQLEVLTLTEELKAQKELVMLLQKALEAAQQEKRACKKFLTTPSEEDRLELVRHKERCMADLTMRLDALMKKNKELKQSLAVRDSHVVELQEHVQMLMQKNDAKQQVILKLSEQLSSFIAHPLNTVCDTVEADSLRNIQEKFEHLEDCLEAYKQQNKFLNCEIHQLTKLWRKSSEEEKGLLMKCAYLEAKNCQIESKFLVVLRQLQESADLDVSHQKMVKRLIDDALEGDMKDVLKMNPVSEFDEYGFKIIPDYEVEDMKLLAKIQALEIRSNNLRYNEMVDKPLRTRWTNYLGSRPSGELVISPELKTLLRCGIPPEYRQQVWLWIVQKRTKHIRESHPHRYQELVKKCEMSEHPATRQIGLDLHRTLTTNKLFSSPSSDAIQELRRILLAFSWQNPTIGYCQGLNRLAALALLILKNEEDAFWCLVAIVENIMPRDYYSKTLIASQADQRVFRDFMTEKMPRLMAHLEEHNVDLSLISFNWFLVVFVESLPTDILLRVWDSFLYEGTKVIFRYALALFKYKEEEILKIQENVEIYQYLRFFNKTVSDGRKLMNIAFNDMNPFPMKLLRNRRTYHLERLRVELAELERIQEEFTREQKECKDKDLDNAGSEDEEDT